MAHLIDKSALVAEIEELYNGEIDTYTRNILDRLKSNIDTLEVKEVDFDTDFGVCWGEYCDCGGNINDYKVAKHFFELGLSASNPITAADRGMAEEIIINLKRVEQDYRINLTKEIKWIRNQVKKGE